MKRNRLLSGALALALALSLTTVPAFAATFPDVPAGYWAESYINDMAAQGVFKGYDNGDFRPKNELQGSEALALCARIAEMHGAQLRIKSAPGQGTTVFLAFPETPPAEPEGGEST